MDFPTNNTGCSYDVFLSFRGEDTCYNFTSNLYNRLRASGFNTFMDKEELTRGKDFPRELLKAIEESRISVVVFSKYFASSTWCLDELVKILECKKSKQQMVLPIFYDVDSVEVRYQRGNFGEAIAKLEERFKNEMEKVQRWREALTEVASLHGWSSSPYESENEFVQRIFEMISSKLKPVPSHVADCPVEMDSHVREINTPLETMSDDVRMLGIRGLGGIGETFTHSDVLSITSNFKNCIGEGGFGKVYHGTLNDTQVAVKRWEKSSRQGFKEFQSELAHMMVHHENLVSLLGYCDELESMALIYEYMANGNLRQYLSEAKESTKILTWEERLQIALDAAQGLEHLHNGCREPIIHRDVKTSNILLNEKWEAKLADFGLSRAFAIENASHVSTDPKETNGYLDPEYEFTKKLTKSNDIYSFGVVLLELVTGRPAKILEENSYPILISQWVNPLFGKGDIGRIVDPRLQRAYNNDSAKKVIETAIACLKLPATQRPKISQVCDELKKSQKLHTDAERSRRMGSEKTSSGFFSWLGRRLM